VIASLYWHTAPANPAWHAVQVASVAVVQMTLLQCGSAPQDLQSVSAAAWQEKAAYCPATHVVHAAQLAAFTPVE
jgi:hypothetical protein